MNPALVFLLFFGAMSRAWRAPTQKPEQKQEEE